MRRFFLPSRWLAPRALAWWLCAAAVGTACGKKGPPLAPLIRVPSATGTLIARRAGSEILVSVPLPTQNVDRSTPVALARVDVYAYTGRAAPPAARFGEVGQLVARIDIEPDTPPTITLRDALTDDELVAGPPLAPRVARRDGAGAEPGRSEPQEPLKRFYMAIPLSERGRPGPPSPIAELALTPLPDPPPAVYASYTEEAAVVAWEPSGGLLGFLLDRAPLPPVTPLDDGPSVAGAGTLPVGPTRYNVYRDTIDPPAPPASPETSAAAAEPPRRTPVNPSPLEAFSYTEPLLLDGRRHCYTVTSLRGPGDRGFEGLPSEPACITAVDTFPPAAPTGLSPIASEGEISLIWEANREADLAGYVVLRGEEADGVLMPITDQPVTDTRYTDRSVQPGVRYLYAVSAVDTRTPQPNISPPSARVDVIAR